LSGITSAQKEARIAERRRLRNKAVRSRCKTDIGKAQRLIASAELEPAKKATVAAISSLDRAAEKGVVHPNNAARRKSRLMKKLNKTLSSAPAGTKTTEP
jgi:small subunit ribosomal protein S20